MLKFANVAAYESYANGDVSESAIVSLYSSEDSLTTRMELNDSTEDFPDFLKKILNEDNIVMIGDFMIKLDTAASKIFIIHKNATNGYYNLQIGNADAAGMMVMDDDVEDPVYCLQLLEDNVIDDTNYTDSTSKKDCRHADKHVDNPPATVWSTLKMDEHYLNSNTDEDCEGDWVDYKYDYKATYQRFWIYYRILVKAKNRTMCAGTSPAYTDSDVKKDIHISSSLKFNIRCQGEHTITNNNTVYTSELDWIAYGGSRSLNQYLFTSYCQSKHTWETSYNHNIKVEIIDGY